jgi:hypothetical protein
MPNWCHNYLLIQGPTSSLKDLMSKSIDPDYPQYEFSLNGLVTIPSNVESETKWSSENWGTNRDLQDANIAYGYDDQYVSMLFLSSWSPSITWVKKVSSFYPDLSFRLQYFEPGMAYAGCLEIQKNQMICDVSFKCSDEDFEEKMDRYCDELSVVLDDE